MKRSITLILLLMISTITPAQTPAWLKPDLYPFESHFVNLSAGRMHYIDEGKGETILLLHGTPSWSFLYRDFIRELSKDYRCLAIDHLGFGLSDKPADFAGTPARHAQMLAEFVEKLGLENITLVVHDFGGPIGLGWANQHPDKVKRVVLFNSWLWETKNLPQVKKIDKLINSWLGRFLYLNMNFSPRVLLRKGFANKKKLSRELHQHYLMPFPSKASRLGPYRLAQSLAGSSDWYQQQWELLDNLEGKPWLILWGLKDDFLGVEFLERWQKRLPSARLHRYNCGHFIQEEETAAATNAMRRFLLSPVAKP